MWKNICYVYILVLFITYLVIMNSIKTNSNGSRRRNDEEIVQSIMFLKNTNETILELKFNAFERHFDIIFKLAPQSPLISESKIIIHDLFSSSREKTWFHYYKGYIFNQSSYVSAALYDQLFYAKIITDINIYEVEQNDKEKNSVNVYKTLIKKDNLIQKFDLELVDRQKHSSVCSLKVIVDYPTKLNHLKDTIAFLNEIQSCLLEVDRIFSNSDFNGDTVPDEIGFILNSLELYEEGRLIDTFSNNSFTSEELLILAKFRGSFDDDCARIVLTHQAINANYSLKSASICDPNNNVILIPLISKNGVKLPVSSTSKLIARQLGYLFGSEDDDFAKDPECFNNKKYIMSGELVTDETVSNFSFSPCSLRSIGQHLKLNGGCLISHGITSDWLTPVTDPPVTEVTSAFYQTAQYEEYSNANYEEEAI
ncbi:hypothetical protein CHUAL_013236 [Chamberlinius hualienensis]